MNMLERYEAIQETADYLFICYEDLKNNDPEDVFVCDKIVKQFENMVADIPTMIKFYGEPLIQTKLMEYVEHMFYMLFIRLMRDEKSARKLYIEIYKTLKELGVKQYFMLVQEDDTEAQTTEFKIVGLPIVNDSDIYEYVEAKNLKGKNVTLIVVEDEDKVDFNKMYGIYVNIMTYYFTIENYEVPVSN